MSMKQLETFLAKATVAQRLVEECGFDMLVFEAGIYDFLGRTYYARVSFSME